MAEGGNGARHVCFGPLGSNRLQPVVEVCRRMVGGLVGRGESSATLVSLRRARAAMVIAIAQCRRDEQHIFNFSFITFSFLGEAQRPPCLAPMS